LTVETGDHRGTTVRRNSFEEYKRALSEEDRETQQ
jgi:hypothetical protein